MALSARLPSTSLASRATSRHHSAAEVLSAAAALRAAHPFLASAASPCALTLTASPAPSAAAESDVAPFCPLFSSRRTASFVQRAGSRAGRHVARAMAEADATAAAGNGGAAGAAPVASDGEYLLLGKGRRMGRVLPGAAEGGVHVSARTGLRVARVARRTKETDVEVTIAIDGEGRCCSATGIPFLDHMMDQLASHGLLDVSVRAEGDVHIDDHHTNEDIGLALGSALAAALGDRKGIRRFGDFCAPLDEALIHVVLLVDRLLVSTSEPLSLSTSDPLSLSTSDPLSLSTSDPLSLSTSDPLSLSTSDPLSLSTSDPLSLSTSDPLSLSTSDPLSLSTSDPLSLSTSDPLSLSTSDPLSLSTSDPLSLSTSDPPLSLLPSLSPHLTPSLSPHLTPSLSPHLTPSLSPHLTPSLSPHLTPSLSPHLTPSLSLHI
ncbi:unnamed protein product [Closterium sp. NIES-64]|nr:unnamed protein product [Closterium sp. NIES-64]